MLDDLMGKVVLVRDDKAGVHVGTLAAFDSPSKSVTLKNARKVWYWNGAASVHGIAVNGLDQKTSKVCPTVDVVTSFAVVEVVLCTAKGAESVMGAPEWKK